MMTLIKFISLVIVSLALNACQFNSFTFNKGVRGNGVVVTEERSFNDESFNRIEVSTGINLFLTQSDSPSISVQADENIQELLPRQQRRILLPLEKMILLNFYLA